MFVLDLGGGAVASSVPAFLQVGDWTYPLIPSHSPVFRSTEGIYMFPDLTATVPGMDVEVMENVIFEELKN
jgi:spartin